MVTDENGFAHFWVGDDLGGARPVRITYDRFPPEQLPTLDPDLREAAFSQLRTRRKISDRNRKWYAGRVEDLAPKLTKQVELANIGLPSSFLEFLSDTDDEMTAVCSMTHAPDGSGRKLAAMLVSHCGDDGPT